MSKSLKEIVDEFLIKNWKYVTELRESKDFKWFQVGNLIEVSKGKFGADGEYVRGRFRKILNKNKDWQEKTMNSLEEQGKKHFFENLELKDGYTVTTPIKFSYCQGKEDKSKGTKEFTFTADNIPSEEEIIEHFKIDTKKFRINQIYHKTSFGGKYSVTVSLLALKGSELTDYNKAFEDFAKGYNESILKGNRYKFDAPEGLNPQKDVMYLCTLSDLHIGNYQKEGYIDSIRDQIFRTFESIKVSGVEKVVILNTGDMLHTDTSKAQTWSNTQLDAQDSFEDAFTNGLDLITSLIEYAANLSLSVTYINVRGNHSFDTEYCLGEALKRIYKGQKNIEILNSKDTRIYYEWNNNGFLFTHGDKGVDRLPLLFATEGKQVFTNTEHHHVILGHLHHNKGKQFLTDRGEYAGIEVRVVGSPTSNDIWHKQNGFCQNKKSLISMLFTPVEGKYAEFNFKL